MVGAANAARFRLTGVGFDVAGPVQGNGGPVQRLGQLQAAQRNALEGAPTGLYEPRPGHVCVYLDFSAMDNGREFHVPLTGGTLLEAVPLSSEVAAQASLNRIQAIRQGKS